MCWIKLAYLAPTVNYSPRQFGFSQYTCCATFLLVRLIVKCACVKLRLYKALPVRRPSLYCSRRPRQSSLLMTSTAYNIPCSYDPYILFPRFLLLDKCILIQGDVFNCPPPKKQKKMSLDCQPPLPPQKKHRFYWPPSKYISLVILFT